MIHDELKEIIESLKDVNSDTTHVEIKSCDGGFPKRIWESISAFANTPGGGVIILGISETEKGIDVTGVKDPAKMRNDLASVCDQMVPTLRPLIEAHKYEGKMIVTAEIPEITYKEKPCHYKGSGIMSGSYIRVSDGDRQLTQYEVQGFLDGRGQPLYDVEPIAGTSIADLDDELVRMFLQKVREKTPKIEAWDRDKVLHAYHILTKVDGKDVATLSGLLCLGTYPQKFLPGLVVHVLVYPAKNVGQTGDYGERLLDNIKVEGPLVRLVPEAIRAIMRNLQKRTMVRGLLREDVYEYPEVFFRESVINALGHRDYSPLARGTAVQIKIFPDSIEITNPGGLFGPITEERLGGQGLQATRNTHLMRLLEDLPVPGEKQVLCENRGTGIPTMIHALMKVGMEPPQFVDLRNHFRVSCSNHAIFDKATLSWLEKYSHIEMSERQRFALAYMHHKGKLTNAEYCRMSDCDSRIATRELTDLVEKRVALQHGVRRWTFYTVVKEKKGIEMAVKPALRKDRSVEILEFIRNKREASRIEIQNGLRLNGPAVRYWLRKLYKDGKVEITTASIKNSLVKYKVK